MTSSYSWTLVSPSVTPSTGAAPATPEETAESGYSVIRKHFNRFFGGKNWDALMAAMGDADDYVLNLAKNTIAQFSAATAEGGYLDNLGADQSVFRPWAAGMSDTQFRALLIELNTGKVTYNSILGLLEMLYGVDALRAHIDSSVGPWALNDGDTVEFVFDGTTYTYIVDAAEYQSVGAATALEVAVAFSRFFLSKRLSALVAVNGSQVRVYTPSRGLRGTVAVAGTATLGFGMGTYRVDTGKSGVRMVAGDNTLKIWVPATAPSTRTDGSFVVGNSPYSISNLTKKNGTVTVVTTAAHGLATGQQVEIKNFRSPLGSPWGTTPTSTLLRTSHIVGIDDIATPSAAHSDAIPVALQNGTAMFLGGDASTDAFKIVATAAPLASNTQADGATQVTATITTSTMPQTHSFGAASVLTGPLVNNVLVTGGGGKKVSQYDGATWTAKSDMAGTRSRHSQVTLPNGNVLVVGGNDGATIAACEIYQPLLNAWIPTGSLIEERESAGLVVLNTGKVLAVGGNKNGTSLTSCELYDPSTGVWGRAAPLSFARSGVFAVTLASGEVFVVSSTSELGGSAIPNPVPEIYTPATGLWRRGPPGPTSPVWMCLGGQHIYALSSDSPVYVLDLGVWRWSTIKKGGGSTALATQNAIFASEAGSSTFSTITGDNVTQSPVGINGFHQVSVIDSTSFSYPVTNETFVSMYGADTWTASAASRVGSTVTVTKALPVGTTHVYINSEDALFSSGVKAVTVGATSFTYTEAGAAGSGSVYVGTALSTPTVTPIRIDSGAGFVVGADPLTASTAITSFAEQTIRESASANVNVEWDVVYPGGVGLGSGDAPKIWR